MYPLLGLLVFPQTCAQPFKIGNMLRIGKHFQQKGMGFQQISISGNVLKQTLKFWITIQPRVDAHDFTLRPNVVAHFSWFLLFIWIYQYVLSLKKCTHFLHISVPTSMVPVTHFALHVILSVCIFIPLKAFVYNYCNKTHMTKGRTSIFQNSLLSIS